jgi:type III secretory pathway component EscS
MVTTALARGFSVARREWRLAVVLWLCGLALALVATLPAYRYLSAATASSPATDVLLQGVDVAVLAEMTAVDAGRGWLVLFATVAGLALLARVANAFFLGGIVEVLSGRRRLVPAALVEPPTATPAPEVLSARVTELEADGLRAHDQPVPAGDLGLEREPTPATSLADAGVSPVEPPLAPVVIARREPLHALPGAARWRAEAAPRDDRPVMHRFFRGAGRFFLRNFVMLALNTVLLAGVAGLLYGLGRVLTRPLEETLSPTLAWLRVLLPLALGGVGVWYALMVYDYACIRVVTDDSRRPVHTWLAAIWFTARRLLPAALLWLVPGLLLAAAAALLLVPTAGIPATTGSVVLVLVVQQLFTLARAWLRTAVVASEIEYAAARGFIAPPAA